MAFYGWNHYANRTKQLTCTSIYHKSHTECRVHADIIKNVRKLSRKRKDHYRFGAKNSIVEFITLGPRINRGVIVKYYRQDEKRLCRLQQSFGYTSQFTIKCQCQTPRVYHLSMINVKIVLWRNVFGIQYRLIDTK